MPAAVGRRGDVAPRLPTATVTLWRSAPSTSPAVTDTRHGPAASAVKVTAPEAVGDRRPHPGGVRVQRGVARPGGSTRAESATPSPVTTEVREVIRDATQGAPVQLTASGPRR